MLDRLKIRTKITIYLVIFSLFGLVFVWVNRNYHRHESKLSEYQLHITNVRSVLHKSLQLQSDFLLTDCRTNELYIKASSRNLEAFEANIDILMDLTGMLQRHELTAEFDLGAEVNKLQGLILNFERNLYALKDKILKKGFFDYGLEGEFRLYAHELEDNYSKIIPLTDLLQLRRSEKDYMLRHDLMYWQKNKSTIEKIKSQLDSKNIEEAKAKNLIKYYERAFGNYVELDTTIGFNRSHGMRKIIHDDAQFLLAELETLTATSASASSEYMSQVNLFFTLYVILFALAFITLIYRASRNISKPIMELSNGITEFINSDYKQKITFRNNRLDEIGLLMHNFNTLQVEIADHFAKFRELSLAKQDKLERQKEKIKIQEFLMRESRDELQKQLKYYSASLNYASRIQKGILPKEKKIEQTFGQVGLIYHPKDVVSGDFYWVFENETYKYAAVADCTGHGVPGALMSILGTSYLNYGVKDKGIESTAGLLNYLNIKVAEILDQFGADSEIKDGMDISLIRIDKRTLELSYSGAQRELIILRDGELKRLLPDRYPIGWILPGDRKEFNAQTFQLKTDDLLVLYTDGVVDQFGGPKYKKFTRNRLYELLCYNNTTTVEEITRMVDINLKSWKGSTYQIDDMCLLTLRIGEM